MKIRDIFKSAKLGSLTKQWLYLPIEGEWTLDTDGLFLDCDNEEKDE
jgi:hypothetical protein